MTTNFAKALLAGAALAFAAFCAGTPARAQTVINVLTGGTSGIYYPLGVALAKIYGDKIPGARTQVQSTHGSVENLNLVQQGRGVIAFTLGDSLTLAWEGNDEAGFKSRLGKLRGIAAIYPNYIQIVASKASGIKSLADLKGKSLSVGAPQSGTELNARALFRAAGMTYNDLGRIEYLSFADSVDRIKKGQLDASLQSAGLGVSSLQDLSNSVDVTIVTVPAEVAAKLGTPFIEATIPAGTYNGMGEEVKTVAIANFLVTSSDVSTDLAYQMTRLLFENLADLQSAHRTAAGINLKDAPKGMPVPLHPGAEKYFRESGMM